MNKVAELMLLRSPSGMTSPHLHVGMLAHVANITIQLDFSDSPMELGRLTIGVGSERPEK